ncbi:hypothetical protein AAEX28_03570 [Lentisphaerota bacterium WC36G]|nr:hypothetical protein LJT99_06445 [Lentisphaerae bacterium WC36]
MSSIERTVYEVKNVLLRGVFSNNAKWQILAKKFASEVDSVNKKYLECLNLIKNDKIIEAIALAEEGGESLVDQLEIINFPEQNQWYRICCERGWKVPEQIDFNNFEILINSYKSDQLIELFTHEYRKLAIKKGSVKRRISLLRHLLNISDDDSLKRDLIALEKTYIADLTELARCAIVSNDFVAMNDILRKLTDARLMTVVDQRVVAKLNRELKKLHTVRVQKQLETLISLINEAYSTFDIAGISTYLQEWDILRNNEYAQLREEWLIQVEEARSWLNQELEKVAESEKQKQVFDDLTEMLKKHKNFLKIDELYRYLKSVNFVIPKNTEQLFQEAKEEYYANVRIVRIRKVSFALIFIIASAIALYFAIDKIHYEIQVGNEVKQLEQLLAEDPNKASIYITENKKNNSLYKSRKLKKVVNDVIAKIKEENDRIKKLDLLHKQLSSNLNLFAKNGLQETWNIETTFDKIKELCVKTEEKAVLESAKIKYFQQKRILEKKVIGEFNAILEKFSNELSKVVPEFQDEAIERFSRAEELLNQAERLMYVPTDYSSQQLKIARKRMDNIRAIVDDYGKRELILREFKELLAGKTFTLDSYLDELIKYSKKLSSVSKGIKHIIANKKLYRNFNVFADYSIVDFHAIEETQLDLNDIENNLWYEVIGNFKTFNTSVVKTKYQRVIENIKNWQKEDVMKLYKITFADKDNNIIPYYSTIRPNCNISNSTYKINAKLFDPGNSSGSINAEFTGYEDNWVLTHKTPSKSFYELPTTVRLVSDINTFKLAPYIDIWDSLCDDLPASPKLDTAVNMVFAKYFTSLLKNDEINPTMKLQLLQQLASSCSDTMFDSSLVAADDLNQYLARILKENELPDKYIFSNVPLSNVNQIHSVLRSSLFKSKYRSFYKEVYQDALTQFVMAKSVNRKARFVGCMIAPKKNKILLNLSNADLNKCQELWALIKSDKENALPKLIIVAEKNSFGQMVFNNVKINSLTPLFAPMDGESTKDIQRSIVRRFKVKKMPKYDFWPIILKGENL